MTSALLLHPNIGAEEPGPFTARATVEIYRLAALWRLLFGPSDRLIDAAGLPSAAPPFERFERACFPQLEELEGLMPWLSDAGAEALAASKGWSYAAAPAAVVQPIHDKAFSLDAARRLGRLPEVWAGTMAILEPGIFANPADAARRIEDLVAHWPASTRRRFTVKPRIGTSGRGRVAGQEGRIDPAAIPGLSRFARQGGAILEPWVDRRSDLSTQLWISRDSTVELLGTTVLDLSASGTYRGNHGSIGEDGSPSCDQPWEMEIRAAAQEIAVEAARLGYWGPCGVDAFVHDDREGQPLLRPIVELNARWTSGIVALGLLRRAREIGFHPGWNSWRFELRSAGPAPDGGENRRPEERFALLGGADGGPALILD